jgi:hypothetical protein
MHADIVYVGHAVITVREGLGENDETIEPVVHIDDEGVKDANRVGVAVVEPLALGPTVITVLVGDILLDTV